MARNPYATVPEENLRVLNRALLMLMFTIDDEMRKEKNPVKRNILATEHIEAKAEQKLVMTVLNSIEMLRLTA